MGRKSVQPVFEPLDDAIVIGGGLASIDVAKLLMLETTRAKLRERGIEEDILAAIMGHASYTGVPRESPMAKSLFAVDELCGFLTACALVRPSRSLQDLTVKSVKKKLKDKAFARGVNRDEVRQGAEELGVPLEEHVQFVIEALRPMEQDLGLGTA